MSDNGRHGYRAHQTLPASGQRGRGRQADQVVRLERPEFSSGRERGKCVPPGLVREGGPAALEGICCG
jgi:hypothetical protein